MSLSLGIVGLPNVGKSTLFNTLTQNNIPAENYPFCTIDPNVGIVAVIDRNLDRLTQLVKPKKTTTAVVEFWDIAGLVKGASEGEGLGNQFLANIRNTNAIVHVLRGFVNSNITHVEDRIDPVGDMELINTELILKDLETVEKRIGTLSGKARSTPAVKVQVDYIEKLKDHLGEGKLAKNFPIPGDEEIVKLRVELSLLTDKPVIFLLNVEDSKAEERIKELKSQIGEDETIIAMDIKQEFELSQMEDEERKEFMEELEIEKTGLEELTQTAYKTLNLMSFYTAGEEEVRAWTIKKDSLAPDAAAAIHTDFKKKFITAEIVNLEDFIEFGGWLGSKEKGKVKLAGKDYTMQENQVVLFRIGA